MPFIIAETAVYLAHPSNLFIFIGQWSESDWQVESRKQLTCFREDVNDKLIYFPAWLASSLNSECQLSPGRDGEHSKR